MSIISHFSSRLKLAASLPPSSNEEIEALLHFSPIDVPTDYLDLIKQGSQMEIGADLGDEGYWFIRIYGAARAIEMNKAYKVQQHLKQALAIGDNEGGDMLLLTSDAKPPGIYRIPMSCISDMDDATYIADNLTELLVQGKNLELLF